MLAEKRARNLIQKASKTIQPSLLDEAFQLAKKAFNPNSPFEPAELPTILSPEIPVLIAEVALDLSSPSRTEDEAVAYRSQMLELADVCLKQFLANISTPNQFLARAYLAQAALIGRWATGRKGDGLIDQVLKALDFVMRALEIATANPRYKFLVYNASVIYWRTSRVLQKAGTYQHLIPSMPEMASAVSSLGEEDTAWKVQFFFAMARVYDQADSFDSALKSLNDAWSLASDLGEDLQIQLLRFMVHVDRNKGGAAGDKFASSDRMKQHSKVQKIKSGITPEDQASDVVTGLLEELCPEEKGLVPDADMRLLGEISRVCVGKNLNDLADRAAKAVESSKEAGISATVLAECTRLELQVLKLGDEINLYTRKMVDTRVDALQRLEKSLISAARANDEDVIHECCSLIWNISLPLLQPNLRKQAKRVLQAAAKALEDIDSPLNNLRVQLHLELARCDMADDLYASAAVQVNKGLGLDYVVGEEEVTDYKRPFDLHLNVLKKKLSMKMSLYAAPDRVEDKAMLVVEQAREVKDSTLKATLLERAMGMLWALEPAADRPKDEIIPPELNETLDPVFLERGVQKERTMLWAEIALIAWQGQLSKPTLQAADVAVAEPWDPEKEKDVVIQQAQVHFAQSEARYMDLKKKGFQPGMPLPVATNNPKATAAQVQWIEGERGKIIKGFIEGMRKGRQVKEDWIVLNAAVYIWNYHLPLFKRKEIDDSLYEALEETIASLLSIETKDPELLCNLSEGLANALGKRHENEQECKYPPESMEEDAPALGDSSCLGHAIEVCRVCAEAAKAMTAKRVLTMYARLQNMKGMGTKVNMMEDPEAKLIMLLELMACEPDSKADLVNQASELLPDCPPNPELLARLSKEALNCEAYPQCMTAAKRAVASVNKIDNIIPRLWRWFALAESMHGQALIQQIDPDKHDKSAQDHLKQMAMMHFVSSAKYAASVPVESVILVSAQKFWNASVSFMSSPATRKVLLNPLMSIVKSLTKVKISDDTDDAIKSFRTKLYVLLFECLADAERWADGLEYTAKSLSVLPSSCHKDLWDFRITFMGKMGKDTAAEMLKVKESGEEMVARVWITLAQSSSDKKKQLQAYQKAVEVLEAKPVAQVEYLILYGEFLYTTGFNIEDARDQLISAADALLELDTALQEEEDVMSKMDDQSSVSDMKSVTSSTSSAYKPPGSVRSSPPSSMAGSKGAKSSRGRTGSVVSSEGLQEAGQMNVSHMLELGRIYIMLAKMASSRKNYIENLLVAQHYLLKTFTMSVNFLNQQAELAALATVPEGEEADQPPEVPKLKIPGSVQEWLGYDLDSEMCAKFLADKSPERQVLNRRTIKKPDLLLSYLEYLIEALRTEGLELQVIPVLKLFDFIAEHIQKSPDLLALGQLLEADLYQSLGLSNEALAFREKAGDLKLSKEEERQYAETVKQREQLREKAREEMALDSALRTKPQEAEAQGSDKFIRILKPMEVHEIWIKQAQLKVKEGDFKTAREVFTRSLRHAKAYEDEVSEAWCLHGLARLSFLEGHTSQAIRVELEAQNFTNSFDFWLSSCFSLSEYIVQESLTVHGGASVDDALKVLDKGVEIFNWVLKERLNLATELGQLKAKLRVQNAKIALQEALRQDSLGQILWRKMHRAALATATDVAVSLQDTGGPLLVEALLIRYRLATEPKEKASDARQRQLTAGLEVLDLAEKEALLLSTQARPPMLREGVRLSADANLATVKMEQAKTLANLAVELFFHPWALQPRPQVPDFPTVEGRESEAVLQFLDPLNTLPKDLQLPHLPRVEQALIAATAAAQLSPDPQLQAESDIVLGHCMKLQAEYSGQILRLWTPKPPVPEPSQEANGDGTEEGEEGAGEGVSAEGSGADAAEGSAAEESATQPAAEDEEDFLEPAVEQLTRAVADALKNQCWDAAADGALDLVECLGPGNGELAAQYLSIHQSCKARAELFKVLTSALSPEAAERVALRKLAFLSKNSAHPHNSKQAMAVHQYLENTSPGFKRLSIVSELSEIRGNTPAECLVVTLVLDLRRHETEIFFSSLPGGETVEDDPKTEIKIHRAKLSSEELASLRTQCQVLRDKLRRKHLDVGFSDEAQPVAQFLTQLIETSGNVFQVFDERLKAEIGLWGETKPKVIFALDRKLNQIPFEGMGCMREVEVGRDFSMSMMQHRLLACPGAGAGAVAKSLSYICDPRHEDIGGPNGSVERPEDFSTLTEAFASDIEPSASWAGVAGSDHVPSNAELQRNISASSGFLFMGVGPLLSAMLPSLLAPLKLDNTHLAVILDKAENEASNRRQSKIDTTVMGDILALRDSWATAALLTLRGVNAVVINQWNIHPAATHTAATEILVNRFLKGSTIGASVKGAGAEKVQEYFEAIKNKELADFTVKKMSAQIADSKEKEARKAAEEAAKAEAGNEAEGAEGQAAEAAEGGEEAEPEVVPTEEELEAAKGELETKIQEEAEALKAMRSIEAAWNATLYGLPTLSSS